MKNALFKAKTRVALEKAIARMGTPYRLAKAVGVRPESVWSWRRCGAIPAPRVSAVESATGISRYELRPDVFGDHPTFSSSSVSSPVETSHVRQSKTSSGSPDKSSVR